MVAVQVDNASIHEIGGEFNNGAKTLVHHSIPGLGQNIMLIRDDSGLIPEFCTVCA